MNLPDYPFEPHYLQLPGGRMHFVCEGPEGGEPVVMLHGNPTWSYFYRTLILALREQYRVMAPDHLGMGLSDKPSPESYNHTLRQRIDDIERFIDSLALSQPITLVVHDWGGIIGMGYATRHPDRIGRLVVLNTAAFHLMPGKQLPRSLTVFRMRWVGRFLACRLNLFAGGALQTCVAKPPLPKEVQRGYLLPYDSYRNRLAIHRFVQDIPLKPGDPAYDTVTEMQSRLPLLQSRPALLCWGMRDFVFDADYLGEWKKHLPGAEVHTFPDAGHYLLEDAGDDVARLVREFLKAHPLPARSQT